MTGMWPYSTARHYHDRVLEYSAIFRMSNLMRPRGSGRSKILAKRIRTRMDVTGLCAMDAALS